MENPLLSLSRPIPFDRIRAEHVEPAVRALLAETTAAIDAVAAGSAPFTYEGTLGALERSSEKLELVMSLVEHLESVSTTPALREAYNVVLPEVSALWSSIPLNSGLWRVLSEFANTAEARALEPTRRRFLDKTLADFRRNGAELDDAKKAELKQIDRELSLITTRFSQNLLDSSNEFEIVIETEAELAGLPESARLAAQDSAKQKGKSGYRFTLQAPSLTAVLTYSDDRSLRERIWRAQNTRATTGTHDNRPLIAKILELRKAKANILGFRDFADLLLDDRMAKTGADAKRFVDELRERTQAAFERENRELHQFRLELEGNGAPAFEPWDVTYYAEKLRRARFALDEEELRAYFPAELALSGAFTLAQRLYGVRIEAVSGVPGWDPEVRAYRMRGEDGAELGTFYVDLYPRENKRSGAWMHGLIAAVPPQPNLAVFCLNASPPAGGRPSLLLHRDVETLFHEFGHLLHHCLSRVSVRSLAGTRVAQDFVELPSQIMENWCSEREALDLFARHYESNAPLPAVLLERVIAARTFRAANMQMRQLGFAAVDLALHIDYSPEKDGELMSYARDILQRHAVAPFPEDYAMLAGFLHLFGHPVGYAAGYYSYKWAEVLDADAFGRFKAEGVLSRSVGQEFKERLLSRGDSADPMDLFVAFRGRKPQVDALLERQGLV
ncbi:MAG TPA: M3 family metallopeptidase [Polyangiaceae bacterium]|jgi:oligopeptidase A|nr:M3 family metallopeptidase [Polyangiaceae bacterium]